MFHDIPSYESDIIYFISLFFAQITLQRYCASLQVLPWHRFLLVEQLGQRSYVHSKWGPIPSHGPLKRRRCFVLPAMIVPRWVVFQIQNLSPSSSSQALRNFVVLIYIALIMNEKQHLFHTFAGLLLFVCEFHVHTLCSSFPTGLFVFSY